MYSHAFSDHIFVSAVFHFIVLIFIFCILLSKSYQVKSKETDETIVKDIQELHDENTKLREEQQHLKRFIDELVKENELNRQNIADANREHREAAVKLAEKDISNQE